MIIRLLKIERNILLLPAPKGIISKIKMLKSMVTGFYIIVRAKPRA